MKLFKIITLLFFTQLVYSQQRVSFPEETLKSRIEAIEKQSGMNIAYDHKQIENVKVSALSVDNKNWEQVLQTSLLETDFILKKNGSSYAITRKTSSSEKKGIVSGKVVDEFGIEIPGAGVVIAGTTTGTQTDMNGNFELPLAEGTYTIEIRFISYQTQRVTGVKVSGGKTTTLNTTLVEDMNSLEEIVITVSYDNASAEGLLRQQKTAAQMSDGISAEQISKTPDSDVGATLKRVTGITTVDNKYVVVRSMGERWNTAAMDGVNLPSTEAYNNSFSFDIIPTAMVESIVVSKTTTPDMNANFAGGYVEVKTKDIPNEDFLTFSWSSSYNDQSAFKEFLTRQRGKNDYFGFDDGTRDFPKGLEPMDWNNPQFFEQSQQFKDNFTTYKTTADPGSGFQLSMGKRFDFNENDKWGFAAAITTKNEQTILNIDHTGRGGWTDQGVYNRYWEEQGTEPVTFYDFKNSGASYSYKSTLAGMLNFGLQVGKSRFSFRNSYTHIYDNTLTRVTGWNEYTNGAGDMITPESIPYTDNTVYPVYQTLIQNKLEATHNLGGAEINWFAAHTGIGSDTKDYTQHQTYYRRIGEDLMTYHQVYNSGNDFARGLIENHETDYNFGASVKFSINGERLKNDIKTGYSGALKSNTNEQQKFFLRVDENRDIPNNERNYLMMYGDLADWFNGDYYVPGGIGWQTKPLYKNNKYEGKVTQHAPYLMFDHRLGNKLRLVWGARADYFKYELVSQQIEEDDPRNLTNTEVEDKRWQLMPSANFTYSPTNDLNLRLAYGKSVLRPQFNERTGLPYFDPVANALIFNTSLTSSVVSNYDFKAEWFLGRGEIISAGLYYKDIDRPIERVGYVSGEGNLYLYNTNSKNAKLQGVEVEVRKSMGFLAQNTFLEKLFISGNFTYNKTKITSFRNRFHTEDSAETYETDRPLYGQTPWAYNLGLFYDGDRLGMSFFYNAKGDQYIMVAYDYNGEEIQMPYAVADAQISYKLLKDKNLEIRINAKNLFNSVMEFYNNHFSYMGIKPGYDFTGDGREGRALIPGATDKYDKNIDKVLFRAYTGRTFGLSVNYTF